jgi:hypothetical protein
VIFTFPLDKAPAKTKRPTLMRVLLTNFERAGDVRSFDPTTGILEKTKGHSWMDADGRFSDQDGSLLCLFEFCGIIALFLDGVRTTLDDGLTTDVFDCGQDRCFRAYRGSELIYLKNYPPKPDSDGNPFWPSEPEDEDFLLWVHNIARSPERQQILLARPR